MAVPCTTSCGCSLAITAPPMPQPCAISYAGRKSRGRLGLQLWERWAPSPRTGGGDGGRGGGPGYLVCRAILQSHRGQIASRHPRSTIQPVCRATAQSHGTRVPRRLPRQTTQPWHQCDQPVTPQAGIRLCQSGAESAHDGHAGVAAIPRSLAAAAPRFCAPTSLSFPLPGCLPDIP